MINGIINSILWGTSGGGGAPSTAINDVLFDVGPIYRNNLPISLNAIPSGVTLLQSRWEIRDMETNALVGASLASAASIPVTVEGFHKIIFVGQTTTDEYRREWDDILILNRKFTEAEADVVVNLATSGGGYYTDFLGADNSGLKIYVKGSGSVPFFAPINLWGSSGGATKFANYVRIQKEEGNTSITMTSDGGQPGMGMNGGRYILIDGHNDDGTVGWTVTCGTSGQFNFRLGPEAPFTNIVFTGMVGDRTGASPDVAGFSLIGSYNQTYNALTWQVLGMAIHHCTIRNSGAEGMYWQFTDDRIFTGAPDYQPTKMIGMICAWNTLEYCGNDGIQPCNSLEHRIHDNYIDTCGTKLSQYHECGISYNAGCSGKVYNNYIINVKVFLTLDSGLTPVDLYAGSTTVQKSQFYNNVMINGTPPVGGVTESIAIYGQLRAGSLGTAVLPWEFFNNTFICSKQLAAFYFNSGGFTMPTFKFFNNLITKQTNATGSYPEVEFIGPGTKPTSPVVNNLVYQNGSESPALFTGGGNYRPSSLSSSAYAGSPTDVSATISGISLNDADGLYMGDYFGAYGRSDLKTIAPTISDPVAATLTTPVAVGSLTESGGTITFEANKVGILYWAVVANGAAAPTVAELMAGTGFLDSGFIYDFGTAASDTISGLISNTPYDLYTTFVTLDWVPTAVVKTDFTTAADVNAPVLSGWEVRNAFPNRLYFNSNEIITGTTYGGFTIDRILGTAITVTGITINSGQLTDHYLSLSGNVNSIDYLARIAYSGSGSNIQDASANALASFAATLITNSVSYSKRIQINITNYAAFTGLSDWNDIDLAGGAGIKTLSSNLDDITNTPSGISLAITNAFHGGNNGVNATAGTYISNANALLRGMEVYHTPDASGTLRFAGLSAGQAFEMIYIMKNTFGTGAGNVNVNGAGAVGYTTGTVERKVTGVANGSGQVDWVMTQTASNTSNCIVAFIFVAK